MILTSATLHTIEPADRRVLGAIQFRDSVTGLPISTPVQLEVLSAIVGVPAVPVVLRPESVRIQRVQSGMYAIFSTPFFKAYTESFDNPLPPAEVASGSLVLRIAVTDAGIDYLPQVFAISLPRSLAAADVESVYQPARVNLYRAPASRSNGSWSLLRILVTQVDTLQRLPGVFIQAFASPRVAGVAALGSAMTEWRGATRGEALLPIQGIERFRVSSNGGSPVFARTQPIEFAVVRNRLFTGARDQWPEPARLDARPPGQNLTILPSADPADGALTLLSPAGPIEVRAGEEQRIHLEMP